MVEKYNEVSVAYNDYQAIMKLTAKKEMLNTFIWCLPNSDARKDNAPSKKQNSTLKFKSEGIIKLENDYGDDGVPTDQFIGEHIVPRKIILDALLNEAGGCNPLSKEEFEAVIKMAVVCLVSHDEDKLLRDKKLSRKMPEDWDKNDIWARYKKAGIKVYEKKSDKYELLEW